MPGSLLTNIYTDLCDIAPGFRKFTRRHMYQFLAGTYHGADWTFMNYGYAPLSPQVEPIPLDEEDEPDRYSIQLYRHVASAVSLENMDVLEVGSGRGGGAHFVQTYLGARSTVGLDFSSRAVAFCRETHCADGLTYITGDAEHLPFEDESFDVVINIESAHCYGSIPLFFEQVRRVLRPGGYFLFADFLLHDALGTLEAHMYASGMELIHHQDITANVLHARDLDHEQRRAFIGARAPAWLTDTIGEWGGLRGSRTYERFRTREAVYVSSVLKK